MLLLLGIPPKLIFLYCKLALLLYISATCTCIPIPMPAHRQSTFLSAPFQSHDMHATSRIRSGMVWWRSARSPCPHWCKASSSQAEWSFEACQSWYSFLQWRYSDLWNQDAFGMFPSGNWMQLMHIYDQCSYQPSGCAGWLRNSSTGVSDMQTYSETRWHSRCYASRCADQAFATKPCSTQTERNLTEACYDRTG